LVAGELRIFSGYGEVFPVRKAGKRIGGLERGRSPLPLNPGLSRGRAASFR